MFHHTLTRFKQSAYNFGKTVSHHASQAPHYLGRAIDVVNKIDAHATRVSDVANKLQGAYNKSTQQVPALKSNVVERGFKVAHDGVRVVHNIRDNVNKVGGNFIGALT